MKTLKINGFTVVLGEIKQPETYSNETLVTSSWEEWGKKMRHSTTTVENYPMHIGKCFSGKYSGYAFSSIFGDFVTKDGIRGSAIGVIVFSDTGAGHVYC